jgi:hypothetical protein
MFMYRIIDLYACVCLGVLWMESRVSKHGASTPAEFVSRTLSLSLSLYLVKQYIRRGVTEKS